MLNITQNFKRTNSIINAGKPQMGLGLKRLEENRIPTTVLEAFENYEYSEQKVLDFRHNPYGLPIRQDRNGWISPYYLNGVQVYPGLEHLGGDWEEFRIIKDLEREGRVLIDSRGAVHVLH